MSRKPKAKPPASAQAQARAEMAASSGSGSSGGKVARIVRSEAGARRYGVRVGEAYTDGAAPARGEAGPKVTKAKEGLAALGLFDDLGKEGIQSDVFGPRLEAGIKEFQKRQGMPVTGKLDEATQKAIAEKAPAGDPPDGKKPVTEGVGDKPGPGRPAGSSAGGSADGGTGRQPGKPGPGAGLVRGRPKMSPEKAKQVFAGLDPAAQKRVLARARALIAAAKQGG
jgi:peptidoglycan hydrolase-like protein with peptidoglycan-binding domain